MVLSIFMITSAAIMALLVIASVEDIRHREIPDSISIFLVYIGIIAAVVDGQIWVSSIGFAIASIVGVVLFYIHAWGGGDAKILCALGLSIRSDIVLFFIILAILAMAYLVIWDLAMKRSKGHAPFVPVICISFFILELLESFIYI